MSSRLSHSALSIFLSLVTLLYTESSADFTAKCQSVANTFNCSGVGLLGLPDRNAIPENTETLDVSNNQISSLTFLNSSILGDSLKYLDLSNNKISAVEDEGFILLTKLISLNLSNNLISGRSLNEAKFKFLNKLLFLNLRENPLKMVKTDTFNFLEFPSLKLLDLSHCEIRELETDSFDLPTLEYFDLSWNQIHVLTEDSFRMLTNLKILDMSNNRISVLNEVPYMPEVVTWNLDDNLIESIEIRAKVEDYAENLQTLFLRNNNILRFDVNSLPLELKAIQVIDMSDNRLHCDCRMGWIKSMQYDFRQKNYTFMCTYPESARHRNLLTLEPDELKCGIALATILISVLLCVVLVLLASGLTFFIVRRRTWWTKRRASGEVRTNEYKAVYTHDGECV